MKIQDNDIIIEFSKNITEPDKCLKLARTYDLYTGAIDNGGQYRAANKRNDDILNELKNNGAISITFKDFTPMMSNDIFDKIINLD